MSYLYLLRRLAWISYLDMKFSEAEKYFNVVAQLMPEVSNDNPVSVFEARANSVRYAMVSNIDKALEMGEELK